MNKQHQLGEDRGQLMTNKKDRLTFLYWDEPIWKEKPTKQNKNEDNTTGTDRD